MEVKTSWSIDPSEMQHNLYGIIFSEKILNCITLTFLYLPFIKEDP